MGPGRTDESLIENWTWQTVRMLCGIYCTSRYTSITNVMYDGQSNHISIKTHTQTFWHNDVKNAVIIQTSKIDWRNQSMPFINSLTYLVQNRFYICHCLIFIEKAHYKGMNLKQLPWCWYQLVHGPNQIPVPSGWAKLDNDFCLHICPVHYLSYDRPLKLAAFIWLSPILLSSFFEKWYIRIFHWFSIYIQIKSYSMVVLVRYD